MNEERLKQSQHAGIDLRRLRYFLAVGEELHFGRAAARLHVAQPALSRQVANLEAAIGAELFDRSHGQTTLTAAGELLLPRARDIIERLEEAARVVRLGARGVTGVISVGFVGSATYSILPGILNQFRAGHPGIELVLHAMNTAELSHALVSRQIDAAFARPSIIDGEVENVAILDEPLVVAMPEDHPLAVTEQIDLVDLAGSAFVLYPRRPRPSFADTIIRICADAGFTPVSVMETMDLQTALGLVAVGAGLSLVPASVELSRRHGVAYRNIVPPAPRTTLSLAWRADNDSATLRRLVEAVRVAVGQGPNSL